MSRGNSHKAARRNILGLVPSRDSLARPELWRWSSFRQHLLGEKGPVKINDTEILEMRVKPPVA